MMRVLLDTHILIWALEDSERLDRRIRQLVLDDSNAVFYSVASIWEAAIKHALHPGLIIGADELSALGHEAGFFALPVHERHVIALKSLTPAGKAEGHKDPFDRIILSQAKADGLLLLTQDERLLAYREDCIYRPC